jgi:hypothetical protein
MRARPVTSVYAWLAAIERLHAVERAASEFYRRFEATARWLTPARIRACCHRPTLERLETKLREARYPNRNYLHGLERVWSRAELGELIAETTNRVRLLRLGRLDAKPKGPALDPRMIPDDRLEHLIQRHRDMAVVEACRAERADRRRRLVETLGWTRPARRNGCSRDPASGPGSCWYWWEGCPKAEARGCYQLWAKAQDEANAARAREAA